MHPLKKIFISGFILLNFLAMVRIHLPLESRYFKAIYQPVDTYLSFFSIYQDWMMFSPDPSTDDYYVTAMIEFNDGTRATYEFEHEFKPGVLKKYLYGERFRKLVSEGLRKDNNSFMWKDAAKFALRKMNKDNFSKVPLKVELYRHWAETPPLEAAFIPHKDIKLKYSSFRFYTYEVI